MIVFDVETAKITQARVIPPIACCAFATYSESFVLHVNDTYQCVESMLRSDFPIIGHHVAFDLTAVMSQWPQLIPLVFRAYDNDRVYCTEVRQKLIDIADGCYREFYRSSQGPRLIKYSLEASVKRFFNHDMLGKGTTQLEYGSLINVPWELWPERHKTYPKEDVIWERRLFNTQQHSINLLDDQHRQCKKSLWLTLIAAWGVLTDRARVLTLKAVKDREQSELVDKLLELGLLEYRGPKTDPRRKIVKVQSKVRSLVEQHWNHANGPVPRTNPSKRNHNGQISCSNETLKQINCPELDVYRKYAKAGHYLSNDIPALMRGCNGNRIHTRFDSLRATGRTSSKDPNTQNWKREPGVRECVVPGFDPMTYHSRKRLVFAQADYNVFELCCWAQVCYVVLGHSRMRDVINADKDPHLLLASEILGWTYEYCEQVLVYGLSHQQYARVKEMRQTAKHCNFGFMGGLGVKAFIDLVFKMSDERLDSSWAKHLRDLWFATWPEAREYFNWINSINGHCVQLYTNRIRTGATFCQSANTFFQGLAADIASAAGWLIAKACYADTRSVMFGARQVLFIHDENVIECREDIGHEVAHELVRLMLLPAQDYMPDVTLKASSCLMKYLSKDAKPTYEQGRLVPWPR